jgi:hypothetical protein
VSNRFYKLALVLVFALVVILLVRKRTQKDLNMDNKVYGELMEISVSPESSFFVTAVILFSNDSDRTVKVTWYQIYWDGGSVETKPQELVLAANSKTERKIRVTPDKGDLNALSRRKGVKVKVMITTIE